MTDLQAKTLAAIARGEVYQRRFGYGAWRIQGGPPVVVGHLVHTRGWATWGRGDGDAIPCTITAAGTKALEGAA